MKESLSLTTALKQQQRLTPMQVQYVRMLEMTTPEIEDAVRRAVDEMPALEAKDPDEEESVSTDNSTRDRFDNDTTPYYNRRANNYSPNDEYYDATATAPERAETLMEALASQLAMTDLDDTDRIIAANIIGNLDDNGYITRDLQSIADDIATATDLLVDISRVNNVWQRVRQLDPAGVGAVDLRDCLLLQLKRLPPTSDTVQTATEIIAHYFDLFSKMHYKPLATALGIDESKLKEALVLIQRLNPKPGGTFASGSPDDDAPRHVIPDFGVEADGDRLILTMLNRIPELSIERSFAEDTPITPGTHRSRRDAANLFIRSKREEAQNYIKVLSMRQETLYRVMQAILKMQRDFFLTGDERLIKPMILKDISELTGYGLSVISRATAGKYVTTPHGTYALKSLFNERPKEDNDTSSHEIFAAMRQLIEQENPAHPLSDERLTRQLSSMGYDIARRTVAKYREKLGFPVARLRKKI